MKSNVPWSVKGIDRDARETAKEAARREGLTVGEWLNQTIYSAGDPNAPPTVGEIEGLKARDLASAIEHLSRRIAGADAKSAEAVDTLARSVGGAVERLQRLERAEPGEAGSDTALAARVAALEEKSAGAQRIDALRALERAVGQVAVQFSAAQQSTAARLDASERQLAAIADRLGDGGAPPVSAEALRDALEGMASRIARAEKIAAEASQLKSEAAESVDADFVHKTGIRLRILGDEIKRGGDQIRTLESAISKLSQQIDAAERRSAEGVQKVAETIADLRSQFSAADASEQTRAEIEAAVSEIAQRTEERIETLHQSFEAIARKLDAAVPPLASRTVETPAPAAAAEPEPLDDLDSELDDAFAALELDDPIPTPRAAERAAPPDEFAFAADEEPKAVETEPEVDTETADVLAEIREAFGFDEETPKPPAAIEETAEDNVEDDAEDAEAELVQTSDAPPPVAVAAPPEKAGDAADADYLKAARRAAREAAAKAAAEEASGKKKLTPKQRAILAARVKRRRMEEEEKAKAAETLVAPAPPLAAEDAAPAPKTSVKERVIALVAKVKARPAAARNDEPTLDGPAEEAAPAAPDLIGGATSTFKKLKSIPNAGGVFGLAAAIVLLLGASVLVFRDFGKPKAPQPADPASAATTPAMSGERIEPAPAPEETIRPRDLYLDNIASLKSATTDDQAQVALKRIEEAAALGHPPAQLQIGELYKLGQLYDRDLAAARQWFERAANGGNVLAMHRLGVMAARGEGGPIDPAASIAWFEQAANFGLVDSQYNLGATYHPTAEGSQTGVQDRAKAYFWYSIAAKNGDSQAGAMAAGLAASMPASERSAKDAEVAAWAAKTPDPLANELAPAS